MQPGYPGHDPYGQQLPHDPNTPQYQDPYAQPAQPYGQPAQTYGQPVSPGQPAYGQQPYQDPYAQQPTSGQPAYSQPYGQQYQDPYAQQQQYQDPYAQQPTSGQPYGQAAYPAAGYNVPGQQQGQNNVLGLIGMIMGIVSIPIGCCGLFTLPFSIAGMVLGFLGLNKANQGLASNRSQALTGLICGGAGLVLGIISFALGQLIDVNDFT